MTSIFKKRYISMVAAVIMLLSAMYFAPAASAADLNESESNNTVATADVTYDDYNNYGAISSTSDVDWWKITPTKSGLMNLWLGNIPSGCNYDLYLGSSSGSVRAYSTNKSNKAEKIRTYVSAGTTYYIKIASSSGSSSSKYLFRAKRYDLKEARFFTSNTSNIDFTPSATLSIPVLQNIGYTAVNYLNHTAASAYSKLPTSEIFVCDGHGGPGSTLFYDSTGTASYLYANSTALGTYDRSLSTYYDGELTNVSLVMFCSCKSGSALYYGNLVEFAESKGAWCAIGWNQTISTSPSHYWTKWFFSQLSTATVYEAMEIADELLYDSYYEHYTELNDRTITDTCNSVILG